MAAGPRMTIRVVAQQAGVSRQTVSNALNAPERLDPATLKHVLAVIKELDYRPDHAARALSSQSSRLIGIRIGTTAHNPLANSDPFLRRLVMSAAGHGYRFIVFDAALDGQSEIAAFADLFGQRAVDGFVITDTLRDDPRPDWLRERNIPFVAFGRPWGDLGATHSWVDVDGAHGINAAVDHLVTLGHSRIAFMGWAPDLAGGDDRREAWRAALRRHGLPSVGLSAATDDDLDAAWVAAIDFIPTAEPTAVVCASDIIALGVQRAIAATGTGSRIAVTGFDDTPLAALARPALTSIRQPLDAIAAAIIEDLLRQCEERDEARGGNCLRLVVAPDLVIRESTSTVVVRPT